MKQASLDRLQQAVWRQHGEPVDVFGPEQDQDTDDPEWSGTGIRTVDETTEAPEGDILSYQARVRGFAFAAAGAPALPQGAIIRYDGRLFEVDEIGSLEADQITVTVHEQ